MLLATLIFAATYVLVSARRLALVRLDRPAGALLGAVLMVAAGVLSPERATAAVDGPTLVLLFGMMGMGAILGAEGFFDRLAEALVARARTRGRLLGAIVWGSGLFAALVTNDAVCVLGAPLVVAMIKKHELPRAPFLLALATGANTGSVATLVGNPQNMLCASLGGLTYRDHLVQLLPLSVAALAVNHALVWLAFRRELASALPAAPAPAVFSPASARILGVIGACAALYTAGTDLAWTATGGLTALLLTERLSPAEVWKRVDFAILVFFAGLFVVVAGLVESGAAAWLFERFPITAPTDVGGWGRLSAIFLVGSNLVSNVPFILVVREGMASLPDPRMAWELLAAASTFAGNLTLLGSVANVIVAERAREIGGLGFREHLRVGAPVALATTALAWLWIAWLASG